MAERKNWLEVPNPDSKSKIAQGPASRIFGRIVARELTTVVKSAQDRNGFRIDLEYALQIGLTQNF